MSEDRPKYYSVSDAAKELDVSRSTLWRWIGEGRLNVYRPGPRTVRILVEDLDAMVERGSGAAQAENDREKRTGIWAGYDAEKAKDGMRSGTGAFAGIDTEQLKKDIKAARGQRQRRRS